MVTEETSPEQPLTGYGWPAGGVGAHFYLSTPELNQRLDLLQHLTANSDRIALVKGPEGIGKTALVERFQALAADHWKLCRIDANPMMQPEQLFSALGRCFASTSTSTSTDDRLFDRLPRHFQELRQAGDLPVILIDDAQLLPITSIISLLRLYELRPGKQALVRLILFSTPQIDDLLATPQAMAMNLQALQVMELPPLGAKQTEQLAQHRLAAQGLGGTVLSESQLAKIYNDTAGVPGEIVKRVDKLGKRMAKPLRAKGKSGKRLWLTLAGGVLVGVALVSMLIYQDRINALFDGSGSPTRDLALSPVQREQAVPLQLPGIDDEPPTESQIESQQDPQPDPSALVIQDSGVPELSLPEVTQAQAEEEEAAVAGVASATGFEFDAAGDSSESETPAVVAAPESAESAAPEAQEENGAVSAVPATESVASSQVMVDDPDEEATTQAGSSTRVEQGMPAIASSAPAPSLSAGAENEEHSAMAGSLPATGLSSAARVGIAQPADPLREIKPQTASGLVPSPASIDDPAPREEEKSLPQPVEQGGAVQGRVVSEPEPRVMQKTAVVGPLRSKPKRETWLRQQKPSAYTLQLLGVQQEEAVRSFLQRHKLPGETAYFRTLRDKRPWFSVVYGVYPNRAAAVAARSSLPAAVRDSGVWPRSLASIQEAIGAD